MTKTKARVSPDTLVDEFNRLVPIGTTVAYRSHPHAYPLVTTTRSEAWVLGGHTGVVLLDGVTGGVALTAIVVG